MSLAIIILKVDDRSGFSSIRLECDDKGSMAQHMAEELVATFLEVEEAAVN